MIRLRIMELLEQKQQSIYWLSGQTGISYQNTHRMVKGKSRGIRLENIEILCQVLDCTPNDLFVIDFDQPEGRGKI